MTGWVHGIRRHATKTLFYATGTGTPVANTYPNLSSLCLWSSTSWCWSSESRPAFGSGRARRWRHGATFVWDVAVEGRTSQSCECHSGEKSGPRNKMNTDVPLATHYCYIAMDATYVTIYGHRYLKRLFVKSTLFTFCPSVCFIPSSRCARPRRDAFKTRWSQIALNVAAMWSTQVWLVYGILLFCICVYSCT